MTIKALESNIRIDKYLSGILDESRETITKMIEEGYILVNKKSTKQS